MKLPMFWMALVAAIFIVGAVITGHPRAAAGVVAGLPVSLFNYWLMASAVVDRPGFTPRQMQNVFMRRALLRMGISLTVLLVSVVGGIEFLIGMAAGLSVQMFSSVLALLWPKGGGRVLP